MSAGKKKVEGPKGAAKKSERWKPFVRAADALPPPPAEAAMALVLGGIALVLADAIDVAASVPWPDGGAVPRFWHYFFDAIETLSLSAWMALPFALAARWPLWSRRRAGWGWLAVTAVSTAAMYVILDRHLERQAHAAIEGISFILLPAYVFLVGLTVPAAFYVAGFLVRAPRGWPVGLVLGTGGIIVGHAILRDDYPGVHAAVLWVSMIVFGGSLAPRALRWVSRSKRKRNMVVAIALVVAIVGAAWHPPNGVRVALFRQPGAVAPWIYAQTLWARPPVGGREPAPEVGRVPDEVADRSIAGVADNPVVVLVTVDALRADVINDPAHEKRYPNITRLKRRGATFTNAVSCGSQTSVSLTSMFASRYFSQMRWAPHGYGRMRFLYAAADESVRFPQLLTDAGIDTYVYAPIIFLSPDFGIVRGFEHETQVATDRRHAAAREVMAPLLGELDRPRSAPAFFYVHLMEPHEPYDRGSVKEGSDWEKYLSEVEVVDNWVGRLERVMRKRFPRNGYILLSADHGEAFGEHGTKYHTKTLYNEMVRVPMILWGPGIRRTTVGARVSLIDVGPTVLHTFRQPVPDSYMGLSLWPLVRGLVKDLPRPIFLEGRLRQAMFGADDLKVIEDTVLRVTEVYDVARDPDELHNLFDTEPERAHRRVAEMRAFFDERTLISEGYKPPFKP